MTIVEAIKKVIQEHGKPMTSHEIYDAIITKDYYTFHAENPYQVVTKMIRRHCKGIDYPTASSTKHFILFEGNKFNILKSPFKFKKIPTTSLKPNKKRTGRLLREIKNLQLSHENDIKNQILKDLKKLTPTNFEVFAKRLLEVYGFIDMKVTQQSKDGGIDGHGKLKVGLAFMNVAFQCKRWTKTNVGRPEVDKFRGAIQGNYDQGVFFTTTSFVRGVEDESFRKGAVPIILMDGNSIVDLMLDKEFGVIVENLPIYSYALDMALNENND